MQVGGTMGWFTYQDQGSAFLDPANKAQIDYIKLLSKARSAHSGKADLLSRTLTPPAPAPVWL